MSTSIRDQIVVQLQELPESNLRALAEVLRQMRDGRPIRRWSAAVGSLSDSEAEAMQRAVEEGCEHVDPESW